MASRSSSQLSHDVESRKAADEPVPARKPRRPVPAARKGSLLPRIARELKSPLRSVRAASQAASRAREGALSRRQEKMLRIITEESTALVCLIEDLLDMAEIESGRIALQFRTCNPLEVARTSLDRQRPRFRRKGVELLDSLPAIGPTVRADEARLRQVFDHLLSSALKFTPRGGRVEIRLARDSRTSSSHPLRSLGICISDTGERLLATDLGSLFEAGRPATSRADGGNGLGLSLARFLVEAHGGEIRAERGPGRENLILFTLPLD
jgi:signal transduction histidine kinase